jgi:hypothetical protein
MPANGLTKEIRRRLYGFARRLARPFADSRRRAFLQDMIPGLVISGHTHPTKVARAVSKGGADIHAVRRAGRWLGRNLSRRPTPRSSELSDTAPGLSASG